MNGAFSPSRALLLLVLVAIPRPAPAAPAADAIAQGLEALHRGLNRRAGEAFRAAAREAPDDPEPAMLVALTYWWRLLQDRSDTALDAPFRAAIEETLARATRRLERSPGDPSAAGSMGTVRVLGFHLEAVRRNYRRAAQEARLGTRILEESLASHPDPPDAAFALGAYDYYADRIPTLARGLAAFLRLPGGDRDRGLALLRRVADSRSRLRTTARLLLAMVCGSPEERCYADAEAHLRAALRDHPSSPLILGSLGELSLRLGRHDEAAGHFTEALRAAAGEGAEPAEQRRTLQLLLAEARLEAWRLDETASILAAVEAERVEPGGREARRLERLAAELAARREQAWAVRVFELERGGRGGESAALLRREAAAHPGDPLRRLLLGRHLWHGGKATEAARELDAAAERVTAETPPWVSGWLEIYRGLADRALGRQRSARAHFRRAAEVRRFRSADRALFELASAEPPPGCAP
jgi:tetratricopeptide (TPR) repeat protein